MGSVWGIPINISSDLWAAYQCISVGEKVSLNLSNKAPPPMNQTDCVEDTFFRPRGPLL